MDLILWRHAEAHDAAPGESDLERALTPRGERQAQRMAEWLERVLPESTRVLETWFLGRRVYLATHHPRLRARPTH